MRIKQAGDRAGSTAARRDQIVEATIAVLAERGYAAASYDAICEVAGLSSKRLISYHFTSKDELLAEVLHRVTTDAGAFMRPALDAAAGPAAKLAAYIRSNVEFIASRPDHVRAVQQIVFGQVPVPSEESDGAIARLAGLFDDGQRSGDFRTFDSTLMAAALRAAIDAVAGRLVAGADPQVCADELTETFHRATRAEQP
ncbi:TetR family transcriptional regulator [Kribbella voronezhensis]|uniref:TetR family transcriptional regulator n=1 Tax=Kribbella voronezhensis TaxID=2512212 RepID=A0A4R7TDG3_9ACTN|nr:TetR/AcrR family transcriptional regulator [Kribbella voronezhensis]TDU89536.1 TetR family transcriptional regulator [Kribbella voronezhensis]